MEGKSFPRLLMTYAVYYANELCVHFFYVSLLQHNDCCHYDECPMTQKADISSLQFQSLFFSACQGSLLDVGLP